MGGREYLVPLLSSSVLALFFVSLLETLPPVAPPKVLYKGSRDQREQAEPQSVT